MPFGVNEGIIAFALILIGVLFIVETSGGDKPLLRLFLVAMSFYMFTVVTSTLGVVAFTAFGLYNLVKVFL